MSIVFRSKGRPAAAASLAVSLVALLGLSAAGKANEATAELGIGGIQLSRNDVVELLSEEIFITPAEVKTTYHFRNRTDKPATFLVTLPLPAIDAGELEDRRVVLPKPGGDNFIDLQVLVDGKPITPVIDQRVTALGLNRASELQAKALPFNPLAGGLVERVAALSKDDQVQFNQLGLLLPDGATMSPAWRLETTFSWQQAFPVGKEVVIEHHYKPIAGTGVFGSDDLRQSVYRTRFCTDADFNRVAAGKLGAVKNSPMPYLDETRLSYALPASTLWSGPIRSFRLVVDKGDNDAVVSFCGSGIRRISTNQFEMTAKNFMPDHEINVLIVKPRKSP